MTKDQLIVKAKALGLETEGLTVVQLKDAIKIATEEKTALLEKELQDALEAEAELSKDAPEADVHTAATRVQTAEQALVDFTGIEVVKPAKSSGFELNGKSYGFAKNAPQRFNFLGTNRSQEEWLADKDAMELLVSGNSSFVKLLKK